MPCIWLNHNRKQLFLDVAIVSPASFDTLRRTGQLDELKAFRALIDTGATSTCISETVAEEVGLEPLGKVPVTGVAGVAYHNNYSFHVGFFQARRVELSDDGSEKLKGESHFLADEIQGIELMVESSGFHVLLGMDVLSSGSLAVEGNGTASWSF